MLRRTTLSIFTFLLLACGMGSAQADSTTFYNKGTDKFWAVSGTATDNQATCFASSQMTDGSIIEIHRSLIDGELWIYVKDVLWNMNPQGSGTLRWNNYDASNKVIGGADFKFNAQSKNSLEILQIEEKGFLNTIQNTKYFTLVMPDNLQNITFSFESTGSSAVAAMRECITKNESKYRKSGGSTPASGGSSAPPASSGDIESALNIWEKRIVQEGLILAGYYNGFADGNFGKTTRDAITKYQKESQRPATGKLAAKDAVELAVFALDIQNKINWQPLKTRTGMSIYYPAAVLTLDRNDSAWGGEILDTQDRKLSLMTFRVNMSLNEVMSELTNRAQGQKTTITYQLVKPNFFIIAGRVNGQAFYARAEQRGKEVRGYDLGWIEQGDTKIYENISVLMSSSFYPFGDDAAKGEPTFPTLLKLIKESGGKSSGGGNTGGNAGSNTTNSGSGQEIIEQRDGALPPPRDGSLVTSDGRGLRFVYHYYPPQTPSLQYAFKWAGSEHLLSSIPEISTLDGAFVLPRQLNYSAEECGTVNAFYNPGDSFIVLCYEMIDSLYTMAEGLSKGMKDPKKFIAEFIRDNVRFILLHETGHALIDMLKLPAVGREEDSVDQLATIMLLKMNTETENERARILKLNSVWFQVNSSKTNPTMAHYADEHSLDAQRYFNMLCLAYGSGAKPYNVLVTNGTLPQARAARCGDEYNKILNSWLRLLDPHFSPRVLNAMDTNSKNNSSGKNSLEWDGKSNPFAD